MDLTALIWIIVGFLLIGLEFLLPGFIVVFFGTAAVSTGVLLALGLPSGHGIPFFVFVGLTLAQLLLLREPVEKWIKQRLKIKESDGDLDEFLNEVVTTDGEFSENPGPDGWHRGRVQFRGTTWDGFARHQPTPGSSLKIVRRDGANLYLE